MTISQLCEKLLIMNETGMLMKPRKTCLTRQRYFENLTLYSLCGILYL